MISVIVFKCILSKKIYKKIYCFRCNYRYVFNILEVCKEENHIWRPDSPPESFISESDLQSDSPALTIETEEPCSTASNSTVSELASPTYDYREEGSPLADELRSRLKLIQSCQTNGTCMTSPVDEVFSDGREDFSLSSSLSSETTTSGSRSLLSPPDCPRLVRSTSLKTGKTPPGTPSRKKIVRFADVLGLDLEAIRHFIKDDDAPIVPQSAFADLKVRSASTNSPYILPWSNSAPGLSQSGCKFVAQFEQPGSDPYFLDKVRQQKVCLENAVLNDLRVTGVVRVLNLGFEKLLQVRYTTTEWAAHTDLVADYVPSSCDGFSDKFSFNLHLPHLCPGQRLLFALRYVANGQEFWDNNSGENYVLKCQAKTSEQDSTTTSGVSGPRWLHHFM